MDVERGFWLKLVGTIFGIGILLILGFILFSGVVYRIGMIGAFVIVAAILMAITYRSDKKKQHRYDDLDDE